MKRTTVVAVAALAALAFVAALGAATASASDAVLCKQNEELCKYENLIPEGTKIVAEAEEPVEIATNTNVQITCNSSTLKATVGSSFEETINASITGWSLGTCTGISTEGDCGGAEGEGLPYAAEATWPNTYNNVLLLGPQWTLTCKIWGSGQQYFKCTLYLESSELHFSSDHEALEYSGVPFQIKSCTAEAVHVTGAFHFTSPESPIYVSAGILPPTAITESASEVKATSATLNGTVNPQGLATKYWFEYGKTTEYGTKIPLSPESVGSGTSNVSVKQTPTGLSENTLYHFCVVAENEVGDQSYGEDKTFTTGMRPTVTTENADHITAEGATLHGSANPNGSATKYWFEYGKTTEYGTKIPTTAKEIGSGSSPVAVSQTPGGLSGTYHFRVVAENTYGEAKGGDKTFYVGAPSYKSSFGSSKEFGHPAGIAMDQSGYLWVADEEKGQIQRWSTSGTLNKTVAVAKPSDVAVDSEDNLWVADKENAVAEGAVVFAINPEFELAAVVGEGELVSPEAIAIDPEGDIWVADTGLNKVLEYDREGNLLVETEKLINEPTGVAVSPSGERIYVVNHGGATITRYNQEGSAKEFLGILQLNFGEPASLDVDSEGNLWVTSDSQDAVKEFTGSGQYITKFGGTGSGTGQFKLTAPGGILVDSEANIWVSDQGNHRVQKWSR